MEHVDEALDNVPMRAMDRLYVGSVDSVYNEEALDRKHIGSVISLLGANEFEHLKPPGQKRHLRFALEDSPEANVLELLPSVLASIDRELKAENCVLVHCVAGRSRSVAVVMAWIIAKKDKNPREALDVIQ